jgi:hypothetical protein
MFTITESGRELVARAAATDWYATVLLCLWRSGKTVAQATRCGFRILAMGLTEAEGYPASDEGLKELDEFVNSNFLELDHASCEALERHRGAVRQYPSAGCALCGSKQAWQGRWVVPAEEQGRQFGGAKVILARLCVPCSDDPDADKQVDRVIFKTMQVQSRRKTWRQ